MAESKTGLVYDPLYKRHLTGLGHPETPRRCEAIMTALDASELGESLVRIEPHRQAEEAILACHTPSYYRTVQRDVQSGAAVLRTGDTPICPESFDAAVLAAGGAVAAVDAVMDGQVRNAFCVVRPPGHHASSDIGKGFCVFNNAAIAARHAQTNRQVARVLIVDWDVHHGNGTQDIFYSDPSVLYFSTHQWPLFPGTGSPAETGMGSGRGMTINCPLPPGASGEDVIVAFTEHLLPAAEAFEPELVIISAGFDAARRDPLGGLNLTEGDFADLTSLVMQLADTHADGRIISLLEGGYHLDALAQSVLAHVRTLAGA